MIAVSLSSVEYAVIIVNVQLHKMSVDEHIPVDVQEEEEVVAMESDLLIEGIDPQQPINLTKCRIGPSPFCSNVDPLCNMQVVEGKCLLCVTDTGEHLSPVSKGIETFLQHCCESGRHDLCQHVIVRPNAQHVLHASCRCALAYEARKTANAKAIDEKQSKRATGKSTASFIFKEMCFLCGESVAGHKDMRKVLFGDEFDRRIHERGFDEWAVAVKVEWKVVLVTCLPSQIDINSKQIGQQEPFLSNLVNKTAVIAVLSKYLQHKGITVHQSPCDADTLIVSVALGCAERYSAPVAVMAEDSDIFALLLYHRRDCLADIYFVSETKKGKEGKMIGGKCINMGAVQTKIGWESCEGILVLHALRVVIPHLPFMVMGKELFLVK